MGGKGFRIIPNLARRFLLSKESDGFLSLISWVSIVGVSLGVLALTVVTSVINGFEGELARVITGMNGDVILYSRADPISDVAKTEAKIMKVAPEVQALTAAFVTEMMISGPSGTSGAVLEGIDLDTIGKVTDIPKHLVSGRLPQADGEVAVASALAEHLGATEGSEVRLIAPFAGESEGGSEGGAAPKAIKATVVGIVRMGMYEYDSKFIFTTLGSLQKFLDQPGRVNSFYLKLPPRTDTRAISDRLADNFGYPFRAKDWGQMNKNIFYAIKLEKAVIAIILAVIVIVAAFNVVSTLMMMIHDKTKEISILKAMGFRPTQSFQLFCLVGMIIGVFGTFFGVLGGLGINWLIEKTRLIDLPADIYYIGFLPVVVRWSELGLIAIASLSICFLATLYPAWKVARRSPLDGIRYE